MSGDWSDSITRRPLNPWVLVALLWVVAALNYLDRQVIFSLFPLLGRDLHASDVQLGLLGTVFLWVYGLLSPFAGYIADRFGRVRVILTGLLVWSAVTALTAYAHTIGEMLAVRALMGISEACYLPAALALIMESHNERTRSMAAGIHSSGLYTGIVLGGTWGGWMGQHYGWRPAFSILGICGISYFVLLWLMLRGRPVPPSKATPGDFLDSVRRLLRTPGFLALMLVFTAISMSNWLINTWMPDYMYNRFGLSLAQAGFSASFYIQAASYAGVFAGGWLADWWARRNNRGRIFTQMAGLFAAAPFLFVMGWTHSYGVMAVAMVTYGLGRGLYDCNAMPVLTQIASPELRATGYGIFNLAGCVMGGATAALAGSLKAHIGLGAAFQLAAILLILCSSALLTVPIRRTN